MNAMFASRFLARSRRFGMLLRRELWECRTSLIRAPLIAGVIALLMSWFAIAVVPDIVVTMSDEDGASVRNTMTYSGVPVWDWFVPGLEASVELAGELDRVLGASSLLPLFVVGFAIFFYCLGALHDDRRDRSVLFWKSLPVSDLETVLSKLATATVIAPLLATLAFVLTIYATLLLLCGFALWRGGSAWLLWQMASPLRVGLAPLAALPVLALGILPVAGWLLLCSAFARSRPFLWATGIPTCAGLLALWLHLSGVADMAWLWMELVVYPLSRLWVPLPVVPYLPAEFHWDGMWTSPLHALSSVRLWLGAAAGTVMIAAAIALRRWREEE